MQILIPFFSIVPLLGCGEKQTTPEEDIIEEEDVDNEEEVRPEDFESGCFIVDGNHGFRWLNDAMKIASDGSTITMNDCDSEHTEQIVIDKSVQLLGPGVDLFTLIAPVNETALTIVAPDVVIQDLSIRSTRSGLSIEAADNVQLENLTISGTGNFAIKTLASFGLSFSNLDLIGNGDGALHIDGGSVMADSLYLSENFGIGVLAQGAATIDLTNSTIELTQPSDPSEITDGFGAIVDEDSTLNSQGNLYSGNILIGAQILDGEATFTDDEISGSLSTGLWAEGTSSLAISNVSLIDNGVYGLIMMGTGGMDATDLTISVDPAISPSYPIDEWADNGLGSMGMLSTTSNLSLENVSISGYNNCGATLESEEAENSLYVNGLTIDSVGRKGLLVYGFEGSITDLSITNVVDLDELHQADPNPETSQMEFCGFVDRNIGARLFSTDIEMTNVHVDEIEGYGLSLVQANASVDTLYAANTVCAGAIAFQASLTIDNGEFGGSKGAYDALGASLVGYESTLLQVSNSTFHGIEDESGYSVFARGGDNFFFDSNLFTGSYMGIYTYDAGLTLSDNTFQDQTSYSIFLQGDGLRSHSFSDNIFQSNENLFATAIQCYSGDTLEFSGDSFSDIYGYYGISSRGCSTEMEDVTFENLGYYGVYSTGGDLELDSLSFINQGTNASFTPAIYLSVSEPTNASIVNSTFENLGGDAISLSSSDATASPLNVIIDTISVTNAGDDGLSLTNTSANLNNITITGSASDGIYGVGADITLNDGVISTSGNDGIVCSSCTMSVTNSTSNLNSGKGAALTGTTASFSGFYAQDNVESGIYANEGDLSLTSSFLLNNGQHGVQIQGSSAEAIFTAVSSDFSGNGQTGIHLSNTAVSMTSGTSTNNGAYGLECIDTTFSTCAMANITGNTSGEQTGCDATCGEEANPNTDTGGGDTGSEDTGTGDTGTGDTGVDSGTDTGTQDSGLWDTGDSGN